MEEIKTFDIEYFKKKEHYLEVISQFATILLNTKTIDEIVWAVAKNAIAQLGYVDCVVYILDENEQFLVQKAAHGHKNPIDLNILNPIKIKIGEGIVGHVAKTKKGEIVSDTSIDSRYIFDNHNGLSEIAVPIIHNDKVIGVIDSEHPQRHFFPKDDLQILSTIASMTATKLVQAFYNEKLQEYQYDLKTLIHIKTLELNKTLSELKSQKTELTDSINYAKRIQKAVLKNPVSIKKNFPESFFYYEPKDIIAGDFYLAEKYKDKYIFAVADCTGHGVPGAIISMICHSAIKRAVRRVGIDNAANVLDETRRLIIETFDGSKDEIKDGMDIGLCVFDPVTYELDFSGANINLHYVKGDKLHVIKADKQPVSNYITMHPFSNHKIQLQKDTFIYLFTDGFADQFGGPKGKKYKNKQLRDLILQNSNNTAARQHENLKNSFENWKGKFTQVDDVCVIGIKV